jgi:hypothetical protein
MFVVRSVLPHARGVVRLGALTALGLFVAVSVAGAGRQTAAGQDVGLTADDLRQGGYVIFFRHATADDGQDAAIVNMRDCTTQRNMREGGLRDARTIGDGFRAAELPVGTVYASELCRAQETAHIAFGRAETVPALNLCCVDGRPFSNEERLEFVRRMVTLVPPDGVNTVIVAHGVGIVADLAMGEAAIYKPDGKSGAMRLARVMPGEWAGGLYRGDLRGIDREGARNRE